jgi:hypothetical protein
VRSDTLIGVHPQICEALFFRGLFQVQASTRPFWDVSRNSMQPTTALRNGLQIRAVGIGCKTTKTTDLRRHQQIKWEIPDDTKTFIPINIRYFEVL